MTKGFLDTHERITRVAAARQRSDIVSSTQTSRQANQDVSQTFIDSCRAIAFDQVTLVITRDRQLVVPDFHFTLPSAQSPHGLKIAKEISSLATGMYLQKDVIDLMIPSI